MILQTRVKFQVKEATQSEKKLGIMEVVLFLCILIVKE